MDKIPFLKPNLVKKESYMKYLEQIDKSRIYSNYGPLNELFEKKVLNEYFQGHGAVTTVNNATTGLMLAISECKRPNGRYAIMPSFTFAATPLAAMWCNLEPYFADIRPTDWCMDEELVDSVVKKLGDEVAVIIPYATFGTDFNLAYYQNLYNSGIPVVVDAAASFGTSGKNGQFGKGFPGCVVFSFHATKSFGIGEGGLVYSGTKEIINKIRQSGNFGFSSNRISQSKGLNSKISEYTAAIALATLDAFPKKTKVRQEIYHWYLSHFKKTGLLQHGWNIQESRGEIPYQFMPALCPNGLNNIYFVEMLAQEYIQARTYFSPACHHQDQFKLCPHTSLQITEEIERRIISLPLWEEISENDIIRVLEALSPEKERTKLPL